MSQFCLLVNYFFQRRCPFVEQMCCMPQQPREIRIVQLLYV